MTPELSNCSAGVFIADDQVIYGFMPNVNSRLAPHINSMTIDRIPCSPNVIDDIRQVIYLLNRLVEIKNNERDEQDTLHITSITIAIPGPIAVSGVRHKDVGYDYGEANGFNRRISLRNQNIYEVASSEIRKNLYASFSEEAKVQIYHDAAAYAFGEYTIREIEYVKARCIGRDEDAYSHVKRQYYNNTVHAQILLDEGIGGAIVAFGGIAQQNMHSEMGHIIVPRHHSDYKFSSQCSMHNADDCLESFIGIPALKRRFGDDFLNNYSAWDHKEPRLWLIAHYISYLIVNLVLVVAPTRIVLSGRIATLNKQLVRMVRGCVVDVLSSKQGDGARFPGYGSQNEVSKYIVQPQEIDAGVYGCALLAMPVSSAGTVAYLSGRR
ncbi:hypothetical protein BKI51_02485 [Alphaproteobacteria bacterium AO1-B]|nr:hypothetical protein BKI51_02485 [Alphaproteobacteria bacterium AO1-B]